MPTGVSHPQTPSHLSSPQLTSGNILTMSTSSSLAQALKNKQLKSSATSRHH